MNKIFNKKSFNGAVYLVLSVFFLTCFPAGALALCLDEEENHLFDQNLNLVDCHSSVEADLILSDEHCSALTERENKDCLDVSLANANSLNLPSKVFLPDFTKVIFTFLLPDNLISLQQQVAGNNSSALSQPLFTSSLLKTHRTVILLI
jgi:hypothetical protein